MNTKLLKQKILDLAIRGKLTQQLKSDGAAKELLTQISEQKRESSSTLSSPRRRGSPSAQSEKTIIPLDKNEAPCEIPANWEWVRLGDLCNASSGKTPSTSQKEFWNGNVLWVTSKDVKQKYIDSTQICLSDLGASSMQLYPPKTMIIVGRSGILRHTLPVAILKKSATVNQDLKALVFKDDRIVEFVYAVIKGMEQHLLHEYKKAGTTVDNLNFDLFLTAPIPLPPLAEQQRIVEKIQDAFAEIDSIENNKELLKNHIKQARQKILDLAIHGKLVPQNKADEPASVLLERITRDNPHYEKLTDIPFEIPESWEWVKLGDVGKWQSGTTPSKSNSSYYKDGTIPWLNTGDLNDGIICEIPKKVTEKALAETSLRLNEAGSVCIAMYGATIGKIGILSMPATTNQACCVCNNLKKFVNQMWLFYFLKNHKQEFIEAGFGGAQPNISKEKITATLFPLPPLAEQKRIVDRIEEIFASLDEISLHLV